MKARKKIVRDGEKREGGKKIKKKNRVCPWALPNLPSRRTGQKCETSCCSTLMHLTSLRSVPNLGAVGLIYFNSGRKRARQNTVERFVKSRAALSSTFCYVVESGP